ncbi:MAG: hypothetical protein OHK0045_05090 [Raineya sp.]
MELIEIITDILAQSTTPLQQKEIYDLVEKHQNTYLCTKYLGVKERKSAIARCLTKHTSGIKPTIGIVNEEKASYKRYYLLNAQTQQSSLKEIDLHPILAQFLFRRLGVYSKTIQATKIIKRTQKSLTWTNPDMVGVKPIILNWNDFFRNEVEKLGLFSNKVLEFYSFEIKLKIDKANLVESYFQAVSNSSWANFNYLAVEDLEMKPSFIDELKRLNKGYGIGIIRLDVQKPQESTIIVEAKENENVKIDFMNFLSSHNTDFLNFMQECRSIVENKRINTTIFDKVG